MVHLIREAEQGPDGALILNHGRGTDEHDLFGLLDALDPDRRLLGITPGAPLTDLPPGGDIGTSCRGSATRTRPASRAATGS